MDEAIRTLAAEAASAEVFGVWFLIGAALVFWMQAGFAMVEAGFTRAKNTGNIIMKNLMDFCIGTVVFILIGFSLLMAKIFWVSLVSPASTCSQVTQTSIFPVLYLTSYSALPLQPSFPALWRSAPSFFLTAFTRPSFPH